MASVSKAKTTKTQATAKRTTSRKTPTAKVVKVVKPETMRMTPRSMLCHVTISYNTKPSLIGTPLENTESYVFGQHSALLYMDPGFSGFTLPNAEYPVNITASSSIGSPVELTPELNRSLKFKVMNVVGSFVHRAQNKVEVDRVDVEVLGKACVYHGSEV